jgi:hypothetical protein
MAAASTQPIAVEKPVRKSTASERRERALVELFLLAGELGMEQPVQGKK